MQKLAPNCDESDKLQNHVCKFFLAFKHINYWQATNIQHSSTPLLQPALVTYSGNLYQEAHLYEIIFDVDDCE